MDHHGEYITAALELPAGFGAGLPRLERLAVSNVLLLRLAPGCLPASLRAAVFENVYCTTLVSALVGALPRGGRLEELQVCLCAYVW